MATVVFDDVPAQTCTVFNAPVDVVLADGAGEVGPALTRMQQFLDAGRHLAGYFSYELGYALEARLASAMPARRTAPLLWFGVFDRPPQTLPSAALEREWQRYRAYAGPLQFEWDEAAYAKRFAHVAERIRNGDVYQANLSMRARYAFAGDARGLYLSMRRQGGGAYSAYIDDGTRQILSFSPELFFETAANGTITCRPMKGTAARARPESRDDEREQALLRASPKERAENVMIVDLVRNDLGRIARTGTVAVSNLFAIESLPTVHQMVSSVSAKLKTGVSVRDMLEALFPCGSVTGAPKIRAMEVIRDLEASPRGAYCGAIGWFAPDRSARFNVAIRTLTIEGGRGELGVGGGLVADSRAAAEYAECRLKARYFEVARRPLKLIETLRREADGYARLERHLDRLARSARVVGIPFDRARVLAALAKPLAGAHPLRVRLTLDEQGRLDVHSSELRPTTVWRYVVSPTTVDSDDTLLCYKTNWRDAHDTARGKAARELGCDEVVFCNQRGELCEGSRSNLFLTIGGELLTPAANSGLLPGCLRGELLASGRCREAVLLRADLARADHIYFGNSLRGLIPAVAAQAPTTQPT